MPEPFVIQRLLNAPRQLVWEVLTQAQHLPHWLGPKGSTMARGSTHLNFNRTTEPPQVRASEAAGLGGAGWCSRRSNAASMQAQVGALPAQILTLG
jgi:hypothetical protein